MAQNRSSNARVFFDYIAKQPDPFAYLSSIPDSAAAHYPFFEDEWIDFKGEPKDDANAKEIWSKALSGYANVTEGLIVWGIDARRTSPRDIDAACGLRLITDPRQLESRLRDWIRDATNPPVLGVEYSAYPGPNGEGFLVCLIPESSHKPHRAETCKKQYYYRAGDDFLMAEPGLLRTLFYPNRSSHVDIDVSIDYHVSQHALGPFHPPEYSFSCSATAKVTGSSTARDTYITLSGADELNIRYRAGADWDFRGCSRGKCAFEAKRPLHPGEEVDLFIASNAGKEFRTYELAQRYVAKFSAIDFVFEIFIADQERQHAHLHFDEKVVGLENGPGTLKAIRLA